MYFRQGGRVIRLCITCDFQIDGESDYAGVGLCRSIYISHSLHYYLVQCYIKSMDDRSIYIVGFFFLNTQIVFAHELTIDMVPKYCTLKAFYGAIKIFCQF